MGNEQWSLVSDCCLFIYLLWPSVIIRITLAAGGLCHFIVNRCSFALDEMTNVSVLPRGVLSTKKLAIHYGKSFCFFFVKNKRRRHCITRVKSSIYHTVTELCLTAYHTEMVNSLWQTDGLVGHAPNTLYEAQLMIMIIRNDSLKGDVLFFFFKLFFRMRWIQTSYRQTTAGSSLAKLPAHSYVLCYIVWCPVLRSSKPTCMLLVIFNEI